MSRTTRRTFLKRAAAASTAFSTFTISGTKSSGRVIGANDTLRVAVAGIHGRGQSHMDAYTGLDHVEVVTLADPDRSLFDSRSKRIQSRGGKAPECVQDVRKVLDDPRVDAVSIATCNHWHSLITIWACQAGKDVYVEKPLSHNLSEGRKAVEAARKYERVVQHGTQQRSSEERARQIAAIQSGRYGKLLVAKGYCCKPRWSIGFKKPEAPPEYLDFNLWLGPAPKQPFHRNLVHYNWHWFWDTGNGDTGNQGVHEMDVARWSIAGATLPRQVWSLGGRYVPDGKDGHDQGQTPNMQLSVYDYDGVLLVFETRGLVEKGSGFPRKVANEFYTTEGVIRGWQFHPKGGGAAEPIKPGDAHVIPGGPFGSFVQAVRERRTTDGNADVLVGHYSAGLCHLGNIAFRLGSESPARSTPTTLLGSNRQVRDSYEAMLENLAGTGVRLDKTSLRVGRPLKFDGKTERFVGDDAANRLLTRPPRPPFVVPETV